MASLPVEAIETIFSNLDIVTVVRLRAVCYRWNEAAKVYLAKLKILYLVPRDFFDDKGLPDIAPWLEPG